MVCNIIKPRTRIFCNTYSKKLINFRILNFDRFSAVVHYNIVIEKKKTEYNITFYTRVLCPYITYYSIFAFTKRELGVTR